MEYPIDISKEENMLFIKKSNSVVTGKYQMGLLGQKLISCALIKAKEVNEQLTATLYPSEIRSLLHLEEDTNFYKRLKLASAQMVSCIITIEDEKSQKFHTFSMVPNVEYDHGKITI